MDDRFYITHYTAEGAAYAHSYDYGANIESRSQEKSLNSLISKRTPRKMAQDLVEVGGTDSALNVLKEGIKEADSYIQTYQQAISNETKYIANYNGDNLFANLLGFYRSLKDSKEHLVKLQRMLKVVEGDKKLFKDTLTCIDTYNPHGAFKFPFINIPGSK